MFFCENWSPRKSSSLNREFKSLWISGHAKINPNKEKLEFSHWEIIKIKLDIMNRNKNDWNQDKEKVLSIGDQNGYESR